MNESNATGDVDIRDEPDQSAYVLRVDGHPSGRAEYRDVDGRRIFTHTEVDDDRSGQGLGTRLVRFALEDVRSREVSIVPLCPLFAAYIRRHPEYAYLVDHEMTMGLKRRSSS